VCLAGVLAFFNLSSKFLPELREAIISFIPPAFPARLAESLRIGSKLTEQFMTIPGVQSYRNGRVVQSVVLNLRESLQ